MNRFRIVLLFALLVLIKISYSSSIPKLKSENIQLPYKIIVGHVNGVFGTYKGYEMLLNQIEPEFPYAVILEKSASYCYFINLYISGRDTTAINKINISNLEEKSFYSHIRGLNKEREYSNRIIIKSIDLEQQDNFKNSLNAVYYMLSQVSNDHYQRMADTIYRDSTKLNHVKAKDLIRLIDSTRMSYLMADDSVLQVIKKNLYLTTDLGVPYGVSWASNREKILLDFFNSATFGLNRYCCITDVKHLPKSGKRKAFLNKANLKSFGISCIYPIYFNHYFNTGFKKTFYCAHPTNPFKGKSALKNQFKLKKGAWLMNTEKYTYLIISN